MRIDDIDSPGMVPNTHRLRQEVIRAISFAEMTQSSEKALGLINFFRQAIAYVDEKILSTELPEALKSIVDTNATSPFEEEEVKPVKKGKK